MKSAMLLSSLAVAEGGNLKLAWKDCGAAHGKVTGLSPDTLALGTKTTVTGTGTVDEAVSGGTFEIDLKASIISQTYKGDACTAKSFSLPLGTGTIKWDGLKCPVAAGNVDVPTDITLSASLPGPLQSVALTIKGAATNGDDVFCMQINTSPASDDWEDFKQPAAQQKRDVNVVKFKCIKKMIAGTTIITFKKLPPLPKLFKNKGNDYGKTYPPMETEYGAMISCIEKAETMAQNNCKVAVVNAASAYHAGGGFTSGGRHALEEAFCSQSTLYKSLEKAMELFHCLKSKYAKSDMPGYEQHIPTDGCIISPHVEIFRGCSDMGYQAHIAAVPVTAVISVAMFNKNKRVKDAPLDAPTNKEAYHNGVRHKFTAMIHGAAYSGADSMIIPDVGCGVFQNDPAECGKIVGEVLADTVYRNRFLRVVFTGKVEFFNAAMQAYTTLSGISVVPGALSRRSELSVDSKVYLKVANCVVCESSLAGTGFKSLAILVDPKKNRHPQEYISFLHDTCCKDAKMKTKFATLQSMTLPSLTAKPESFLKALDLNGNGLVEMQEMKCLYAVLWDGDLTKDTEKFEAEFEAKWQAWDDDETGNIKVGSQKPPPKKGKKELQLGAIPAPLLQWLQEQSKKAEVKAPTPATFGGSPMTPKVAWGSPENTRTGT